MSDDLIGKVFGRLTVIKREKNRKYEKMWLCECECGNRKIIYGSALLNNKTNSCGCLRKELMSERIKNVPSKIGFLDKECGKQRLYYHYKYSAKRRNINFELSKEQFFKLTKQNCFYCNSIPEKVIQYEKDITKYIYNGVDRIDSNIGYLIENCVSCCNTCNVMKNNMPLEKFINQIKKISERF